MARLWRRLPGADGLVANVPGADIAVTQPVAFIPPPPLSAWTWINQGPYDNPTDWPLLATAEDIPGGLRFQVPCPTNFPALIVANEPLPAPPYTITTYFRTGRQPYNSNLGISLHNSDSGETISLFNQPFDNLAYIQWELDNITTESINYFEAGDIPNTISILDDAYWLRIQNDGSNVNLYLSTDGISFVCGFTVDVSSMGSFDQYGIYLWNFEGFEILGDPPHLEVYGTSFNYAGGRLVADLLSLEVVPELVDTATFI